MKYTIREALEAMAGIANDQTILNESLPDEVSFADIAPGKIHVHRGITALAKEVGAVVDITRRNDSEYPFRARFSAMGIDFFQIGATEAYARE